LMPATGRPYTAVPDAVLQLPMIRYLLTSNGAAIWDRQTESIVCSDLISYETACTVIDILEGEDVLTEFYSMGRSYACADGYEKALHVWDRIPESFKKDLARYRQPVPDIAARVRSGSYPVEKFRVTFGDAALQERIMKTLSDPGTLKIVHGASYNIELNTPTGSKGCALRMFARQLGFDMDEVMAFGDAENDLTMLEAAGTGIAMGNALPEVKAAADLVTLSNDEDGVAAAIEKYVLRGSED
ncbi:MAG: HAD hydrolase family protein, partial [bacterium]